MWISKLSEKELDQAAALERACFGSQAWSEQALADAAGNENALYLVMLETGTEDETGLTGAPSGCSRMISKGSGQDLFEKTREPVVVGYCGVWLSFEEGEIMNVAVREEFRRRGCAGRLLRELISQAKERGVSRFILEVREGNDPAIRLYESLGFQRAGVRKNFYSDPRENALILLKEI